MIWCCNRKRTPSRQITEWGWVVSQCRCYPTYSPLLPELDRWRIRSVCIHPRYDACTYSSACNDLNARGRCCLKTTPYPTHTDLRLITGVFPRGRATAQPWRGLRHQVPGSQVWRWRSSRLSLNVFICHYSPTCTWLPYFAPWWCDNRHTMP